MDSGGTRSRGGGYRYDDVRERRSSVSRSGSARGVLIRCEYLASICLRVTSMRARRRARIERLRLTLRRLICMKRAAYASTSTTRKIFVGE